MYSSEDFRIVRELHNSIESELLKIGLLFRVFSRAKTSLSLEKKINKSPGKYSESGKKIQDVYGIRVILYFQDDSEVAQRAIKNIFVFDEASSMVDEPSVQYFSATRCNCIFRLPDELQAQSLLLEKYKVVDPAFEVQFRTILSEGWHEIDHDLRYKCPEDWDRYSDASRALNGIFASLETADWGMLQLFQSLSYKHYKSKEWLQMIRTKFRLRIEGELSKTLEEVINSTDSLGKRIFRINRRNFLTRLLVDRMPFPITMDNIIYLINYYYLSIDEISRLTPSPINNWFSELDDARSHLATKLAIAENSSID